MPASAVTTIGSVRASAFELGFGLNLPNTESGVPARSCFGCRARLSHTSSAPLRTSGVTVTVIVTTRTRSDTVGSAFGLSEVSSTGDPVAPRKRHVFRARPGLKYRSAVYSAPLGAAA